MAETIVTETKIHGDIWQFNESNNFDGIIRPYVDAYLIIGDQRALLVDTLMTCPNLYQLVREKTDLPLTVILTHGHRDHAGISLRDFHDHGCTIFMNFQDLPILLNSAPASVEESWFTSVFDGMRIELGGRDFEILTVPGHSPGCLVVLDQKNQILFSGDSIGSGHFWMQLPTSLPLSSFIKSVTNLYERTKTMRNLLIYPGHRNQSPVQLKGQYIKDCVTITKLILDGTLVGKDTKFEMGDRRMEFKAVTYGLFVSYCYNPENL